MFFKTSAECIKWAKGIGLELTDKGEPVDRTSPDSIRVHFHQPRPATVAIAKHLVTWLGDFSSCLLWVTEFGIWPSSENLHLYYRLRTSYGDFSELKESPGHHFLSFEQADLVSFVDLVMQFGWGGHLLCAGSRSYAWISHDEWLVIDAPGDKSQVLTDLDRMSLQYEQGQILKNRK
jgi:hypothetical protein